MIFMVIKMFLKRIFLSFIFLISISGCEIIAIAALVDAVCEDDADCYNAAAESMFDDSSYDYDYDYDWDQFYDQYYNLVWRCRGIQTGQFADNLNCIYDTKDDDRWPDK